MADLQRLHLTLINYQKNVRVITNWPKVDVKLLQQVTEKSNKSKRRRKTTEIPVLKAAGQIING